MNHDIHEVSAHSGDYHEDDYELRNLLFQDKENMAPNISIEMNLKEYIKKYKKALIKAQARYHSQSKDM